MHLLLGRIHPGSSDLHDSAKCRYQSGVILVRDTTPLARIGLPVGLNVDEEESELDLINRLTDIVRDYDPDILAGYEVQSSSWGYVIERARMHFGILA